MSLLLGLPFIWLGVIYLWRKDTAWEWRERRAKARNYPKSHRTPDWDESTNQIGWIFLAVGITIIVSGFAAS